MLNTHEQLFGKGLLAYVSTDKGYNTLSNEQLLIEKRGGLKFICSALIEHRTRRVKSPKKGGQLGRSCMKSDETMKNSGYLVIFGFDLRQLMGYFTS